VHILIQWLVDLKVFWIFTIPEVKYIFFYLTQKHKLYIQAILVVHVCQFVEQIISVHLINVS